MKLLDVSRCHEDSPDFRSGLTQFEEATTQLEKKLKRILSICQERQSLAVRERSLTLKLVREFEFFATKELDCEEETESAMTSIEVMTAALKQLVDNQERLFEQIDIGILKPLQHFLANDVENVQESRKAYQSARTEALHSSERFCQCKKHELTLLNELSLSLFDSRFELHRAACNYAMDLNCLHSKKTPMFLQKVVDYMTSQLSYFHLGQITLKDTESHISSMYSLLEKIRPKVTSDDTQQRTQAKSLLEQVLLSRAQDLVSLHCQDLLFPMATAKTTVSRHLAKNHPEISFEEKEIDPGERKRIQARTKSGYLRYSEPKTFGTAWIRLFFAIRKGMLVSAESTSKVKVPITLNLSLCNVKPAQVTDTERNFCFKVISPVRTLLLQAENTKEMRCWMDVLTNAITHALHGQSLSPDRELPPGAEATPTVTHPFAPIAPSRPKRSRMNVLKELYAIPGNEICADCGNSQPKWASVNLGVLICIECSGVHRSLGVYVSQVRSLTLDTLKPEWVEQLKEVGNRNSNAIYEAHLPEDFDRDAVQRDETRQEFITEKYMAMKYTPPEDKERILEERLQARAESLRRSSGHSTPTGEEGTQPSPPDSELSSNDKEKSEESSSNTLKPPDPATKPVAGEGRETSGGREGGGGKKRERLKVQHSSDGKSEPAKAESPSMRRKMIKIVKGSVEKSAKND